MSKIVSWIGLLAITASLALGLGCKRSSVPTGDAADAAAVEAASKLPEGDAVITALNQKDYPATVAGLAKIQQSIAGGEQESNFLLLKQHVKSKLLEVSDTDPKAKEALDGLRFLTQGR